jgi:choice-of-anchor C domain-containing protein
VASFVAASSTAFAAPFTNGDFESGTDPGAQAELLSGAPDIQGWTILDQLGNPSNTDVTYVGSFWTAQSGSRSVELNGQDMGGIQQTFDVVSGQTYQVSFWLAADFQGEGTGSASVRGMVQSGTNFFSEDFKFDKSPSNNASNLGWVLHTLSFVADGPTATLTFLSLNDSQRGRGPVIDNVTITAVPIPMALPLMGFALGALGVIGMRRRRRAGPE